MSDEEGGRFRFRAAGMTANRKRLGLSAGNFELLVGPLFGRSSRSFAISFALLCGYGTQVSHKGCHCCCPKRGGNCAQLSGVHFAKFICIILRCFGVICAAGHAALIDCVLAVRASKFVACKSLALFNKLGLDIFITERAIAELHKLRSISWRDCVLN
ncbi:hypothetical protein [Rubrivivax gelatinosus]|uniref:Uncharacterized protein n=1 Tax=Rubrivivax gelatinosus (strain NBRC 100245 / IL144) TaxID=983917 RepID=I0HQ56_RUBGI|nr:hypothetical protein [Rubrivivax gelatinosus]BAL95143.1 hypothetical protein RGE_18020 [Rubrivivax gelatinosus IL144]